MIGSAKSIILEIRSYLLSTLGERIMFCMSNSNIDQILKSLQESYLSKDFDGAIKTLIKNKSALEPGLFHYNLGTIHAKKGELAVGRYHLEKALKNNFINTKIMNNIDHVESTLSVSDLSSSKNYFDRAIDQSLKFSSEIYLLSSLLILVALLFSFKKRIMENRKILILLTLFSFLPLAFFQFHLKDINYAISFKNSEVREGPSGIFATKTSLATGAKVIVGEFESGWVYVKYPIQLSGWVKRSDLGFY